MSMRPRSLILTALLGACIVLPASAQSGPSELDQRVGDWAVVDEVEYGVLYIDTTRVEAVEADVYNIRTRWSFADVQTNPDGQRYSSSVAVRAINCRSREMAIVAYADLDGERIVKTSEQPLYAAYWFDVSPASMLDEIASRACEMGRRMQRMVAAGADS